MRRFMRRCCERLLCLDRSRHGTLRQPVLSATSRPTRSNLREGVERIGTGDLGYRLDLKTGDEIEVFADEFNKMTTQLQESYSNLEQKVEDRTRELTESLEQQTATSEILGSSAARPLISSRFWMQWPRACPALRRRRRSHPLIRRGYSSDWPPPSAPMSRDFMKDHPIHASGQSLFLAEPSSSGERCTCTTSLPNLRRIPGIEKPSERLWHSHLLGYTVAEGGHAARHHRDPAL